MNIKDDIIQLEMTAFEEYLKSRFPRENKFSDEVVKAIFSTGGKRIRPYFTLLFSMTGKEYSRERSFPTAAAVEMLHTATLVHDDIIDNADIRRNVPTVNAQYGVHMAVYTGDYLLLKALQEIIQLNEYDSAKIRRIVKTLSEICTGEIDQYFSKNDISSVFEYFKRIRRKTALLFAASCALGAYDAGHSDALIDKAFRFGIEFGMAFQIRDDISNFFAKDKGSDKPVHNDIFDGIVTLPMIIAASRNIDFKQKLGQFLKNPFAAQVLINDMISAGGIEESQRIVQKYVVRAKKTLAYFNNDSLSQNLDKLLSTLYA